MSLEAPEGRREPAPLQPRFQCYLFERQERFDEVTMRVLEYLSDANLEGKLGHVYLALWPSDEIPTPQRAIDFLRAKEIKPIPLFPVQWGSNLTVIVEASSDPRIWFGRQAPTGNWEADLAQIIRVLGEHCIDAELSLDSGRPISCDPSDTES